MGVQRSPRLGQGLWWLAVVCAPWSVETALPGTTLHLAVPQEPVLVLVVLVALVWGRDSGLRPALADLRHPLMLAAAAMMAWSLVCVSFSGLPVISFKVVLVRSLQAVVYLVIASAVLRDLERVRRLALVGALSLAPVVMWSLTRVSIEPGPFARHSAPMPFFPNRLELTVVAGFWLISLLCVDQRWRRWSVAAALPLLMAMVALRGRAAVVGLVAGMAVWAVIRRRPRPASLVAIFAAGTVLTGALALDFLLWREGAGREHPATTVAEPLWRGLAASAPAVDESVLERFNRWRCALLMAGERPVTGYGPGTFERFYGPFQRPSDRTRWSTDRGDLGDAHSEPLGRLAEEGTVGLALLLVFVAAMIGTGLRVARRWSGAVGSAAAVWTGGVAALAVAALFVGVSDLSGTGLATWLAAAVLLRLDRLAMDREPPDRLGRAG